MSTPPLPKFRYIGFAGSPGAKNAAAQEGIRAAIARVRALSNEVEWLAVSPIAGEADIFFATEAQSAGLGWHALLSVPSTQLRSRFDASTWPRIETLLARADDLQVLPPVADLAETGLDAALETIDRADVMLVVWEGKSPRAPGGASAVVRYAREHGRPMVIIDPTTGAAQEEHFDHFSAADSLIDEVNALPPPTDVASAEAGSTDRPLALVEFWQKADLAATSGAPRFRRLVTRTVLLQTMAALLAALAAVFAWRAAGILWAEAVLVLSAVATMVALMRSHRRRQWLRFRIVAEVCRSALGAWGVPAGSAFLNRVRVPELQGLLRSLTELQRRYPRAPIKSLTAFKEGYLIARIERQASYFRRQELKCAPLARRLRLGFWIASGAAVVAIVGGASAASAALELPTPVDALVFRLLPIALPLVAVGCLAFVSINDLQRRLARFREMQALLERSRRQLMAAETWNAVAKLISITEEGLLHEVLEWHAVAADTESH